MGWLTVITQEQLDRRLQEQTTFKDCDMSDLDFSDHKISQKEFIRRKFR